MRVAIVQLPARFVEDASLDVALRSMALILETIDESEKTDLVVFPENFPCSNVHASVREDWTTCALERLSAQAAFIAGGYVLDRNGRTRNASFLINDRKLHGTYYKRIPWQTEAIEPGEEAAAFRWGEFEVFPLICADVCEAEDREDGQGVDAVWPLAPKHNDSAAFKAVVVTTYGADLREPY